MKNQKNSKKASTPESLGAPYPQVSLVSILTTAGVDKAKAIVEASEKAPKLLVKVCSSIDRQRGELTAQDINATFRVAKGWAKQSGSLRQKLASAAVSHPDPQCEMGDVVTVAATSGKRKGEKVTGRFVKYNESTGRSTILVNGNGGGFVNGFFESKDR